MNSKHTWVWVLIAAGVFAVVYFERNLNGEPPPPMKVLPALKASSVTSIQIQPESQLKIRADRTNNTWRLTQPVNYRARDGVIDQLVNALEQLAPATYISEQELRANPHADHDYGFETR